MHKTGPITLDILPHIFLLEIPPALLNPVHSVDLIDQCTFLREKYQKRRGIADFPRTP